MDDRNDKQSLQQQLQLLELKNAELKQRILVLSKDNRDQLSLIQSLLEKTPFGIILLDGQRNIIRINSVAETILKLPRNNVVGKNCNQIFRCHEIYGHCPILDKGQQLDRMETLTCRDDARQQTLLRSTMINQHQNETIIIEAFVDISEIKQAQVATINANRAKDDFIAKMSHELRTPLNAIIGFSEIIAEDLKDMGEDKMVQNVNKIHRAGFDMLHLVEGLLDFSRLQANMLQLNITEGKISEIINHLQDTVEPLLAKNNNSFTIQHAADALLIETDLFRLHQVLLNLISNANKFTNNGTIKLDIHRSHKADKNMIEFRVTDTGIGMEEAVLEKIFQPFEQVDNSSTRRYSGTGLGLTITKELVHLMHGTIDVKSQPSKGSEFTIRLPELY